MDAIRLGGFGALAFTAGIIGVAAHAAVGGWLIAGGIASMGLAAYIAKNADAQLKALAEKLPLTGREIFERKSAGSTIKIN